MQNKYCLPVIKTSKEEVLRAIEDNQTDYGYFEIWTDYIEDFEISFAEELIEKFPGRLVFVLRRQNLNPIKMPVDNRFKLLEALGNKDCLVDLDISCQQDDLEYAKSKKLKTIVSYHNYEKTPSDKELFEIISKIKSYTPYIVKVSTMCSDSEDALRLFKLKSDLLQNNEKHIVLGMGKAGKITRIFGALWDNELIFIPETKDEASAPGQISREEFDKIMERINGRK